MSEVTVGARLVKVSRKMPAWKTQNQPALVLVRALC